MPQRFAQIASHVSLIIHDIVYISTRNKNASKCCDLTDAKNVSVIARRSAANICADIIVYIKVSTPTPPQKHHPLFLAKPPLKSASCPSPIFRQYLPIYWFFVNPPLKLRFFHESPKYGSYSSFTRSYLLQVTKFLVKIFQFEFLVMTVQSILVQTFLSITIPDFIFYLKLATPLKKDTPPPLSPSFVIFLFSGLAVKLSYNNFFTL